MKGHDWTSLRICSHRLVGVDVGDGVLVTVRVLKQVLTRVERTVRVTVDGQATVEVAVTETVMVERTVLVVTDVFGQEVRVVILGTKRVLVRKRVLVVTEVTVLVTVTVVVAGDNSVDVNVVVPTRIELVDTVRMLVVIVSREVSTCVSVERTTVEMEVGVNMELVLRVLVVTLTWVKMSDEMEKVVNVRTMVVACCRVAVMTGGGGGAVHATGKKLSQARRNVLKG